MTSAFTHHSSMGAIRSHAAKNDSRPVPIRVGKVNRTFLAKAIRSGASLRCLSQVLNISVHQVYQLCLHYGLAVGKNISPHLPTIIRQQAQAGKSLVLLAQQHHISYYRVAAIVQRPTDNAPSMSVIRPVCDRQGPHSMVQAKRHGRPAPLAWRRGSKPAA